MIEICTVGGYNEVGKNCTAIRIDDEVVIFDIGLFLDRYIKFSEEEEDVSKISPKVLINAGAIPNVNRISDWMQHTIGIVTSHAHLDHIGAIPFVAEHFTNIYDRDSKAEIICTPYTKEVLSAIISDNNFRIGNKIVSVNPNSRYRLSSDIELEFINATHSIPQTSITVLHTKYGKIVYANDFKFDLTPVLGKTTNTERLKEIGKEGVICLIMDSLYAKENIKTPSESVARELLREVMLGTTTQGKAIVLTTFSSHLARLKSAVEFGKKLNRKIVFLGRSLCRYVNAAENIQLVNFSKDVQLVKYKDKIRGLLKKIERSKDRYLIVCTGHQGEPKAVLSQIANKKLPFRLEKDDSIIFSCKTIPSPVNIKNREMLEAKLKKNGVRIFRDVHVSGHGGREDQRDLINMLNPQHIIPSHGPHEMVRPIVELVREMGEKGEKERKVHLMSNGQRIRIS